MKRNIVLWFCLGVVVGAVAVIFVFGRYSYETAGPYSSQMWRHDRLTGRTDLSLSAGNWKHVREDKPQAVLDVHAFARERGMINLQTFQDEDGSMYDVPPDKMQEFLVAAPKARPIQAYKGTDGEMYDVPKEREQEFLAASPGADPVRTVKTLNGEKYYVPDSEREDFRKALNKISEKE